MARHTHELPAVLIPDDDICIQISIPNHHDYISLFLGALRMLETQRRYKRDESGEGAKIVAAQFRDRTVTPAIETIAQGLGCASELSQCLSYPNYSGFVHYYPNSPFTPTETVPDNYLLPPFWRWGNLEGNLPDFIEDWFNNAIEDFTGYKENDAIVFIASFPFAANWLDFLNAGGIFPRVEIKVTGSGVANITFLSFPAGGRVIVELDEMPNLIDIIDGGFLDPASSALDTDRDLTSFPPEENVINVYPVNIETEGEHTIYCVWLPIVNDSAFPVGFGGGIRTVELCGGLTPFGVEPPPPPPPLEGVEELKPQFRFTAECGLEYRLVNQDDEVIQDWLAIEGWIENGHICFDGLDGVDGTDGVDGVDGVGQPDPTENEGVTPPTVFRPDFSQTPYESGMCRASYYIADQLIVLLTDTWNDWSTLTPIEWLPIWLAWGGLSITLFQDFWQLYISLSDPNVPTDAATHRDAIAEFIFCGEVDKQAVLDNIGNDTALPSNVRNALYGAWQSVTQDKINNWAFIGANGSDEFNDCSEYCTYDHIFWFADPVDYTPVEGQTVTFGDTWAIYADAEFVTGTGYSSTDGSAEIAYTLPRDCRIDSMYVTVRKHEACSQFKIDTTWRGLAGTDPEAQSPEGTVTVDTEVTTEWNVHHAEIQEMLIRFSNNVCLGEGTRREYVKSVRMVGTGARPR